MEGRDPSGGKRQFMRWERRVAWWIVIVEGCRPLAKAVAKAMA